MPSAAIQRNLEMTVQSKGSQEEKDKHHVISLTCGLYTHVISQPVYKADTTHGPREQTCGGPRKEEVERGKGEVFGVADANYYNRMDEQQALLYSTGNHVQYLVINRNAATMERAIYINTHTLHIDTHILHMHIYIKQSHPARRN